jgi:uncharacterized protein YaiE (UPF0345 family)
VLHLLDSARISGRKSIVYIVAIFFSYCAIDSYYSFGESKFYVRDSIEWIAQNTDGSSELVTNNHAIAYFSGKVEDYDLVQRNLTEEEILSSEVGNMIAAELTFETKNLLEKNTIVDKLKVLAYFPDIETKRIVIFERVDSRTSE